ncbi:hypothetical protein H5T54_02665 [Candidatus Bipolaricaulota bacterium]|nr:hypothetical protein [Candidatus Bipolaricaulota bacterium]
MGQGTVGASLRYTWELVDREVLDGEALQARLREALAATEGATPPQARMAREARSDLGIDL